jgi:hypothetical protein
VHALVVADVLEKPPDARVFLAQQVSPQTLQECAARLGGAGQKLSLAGQQEPACRGHPVL